MTEPKKKKNSKSLTRSANLQNNKNAEKFIDWKRVDDMLKVNATGEEVAAILGVDYDTIANHCRLEKSCSFSDYIKTANAGFRLSLRQSQKRSMEGVPEYKTVIGPDGRESRVIVGWLIEPSVTMQIWLGKQRLGQSEHIEQKTDNTLIIKHVYPKDYKEAKESLGGTASPILPEEL